MTERSITISGKDLERIEAAYAKVKFYPESRPDGWADMLELRQAVEIIIKTAPRKR